jgi:hypothetical protein
MKTVTLREENSGYIQLFEQAAAQNLIPSDTMEAIKGKRKAYYDKTFYVSKALGANPGGIINCLESATVKKVGVTNFEAGKIPKNAEFVGRRLGIRFGWSPTNVAVEEVNFKSTIYNINDEVLDKVSPDGSVGTGNGVVAQFIPNKFLNAEYSVQSTTGGELMSGLVRDGLIDGVSSQGVNSGDDNLIIGEVLTFLKSETDINFQLKTPESTVTLPGFWYVQFVLQGIVIANKVI